MSWNYAQCMELMKQRRMSLLSERRLSLMGKGSVSRAEWAKLEEQTTDGAGEKKHRDGEALFV